MRWLVPALAAISRRLRSARPSWATAVMTLANRASRASTGMYQMVQCRYVPRAQHHHQRADVGGLAPHHRRRAVAVLHADRAVDRAARARATAGGQLGPGQAAG